MIKARATDIEIVFDVVDVKDKERVLVMNIRIDFAPHQQQVNYLLRNVPVEREALVDFEAQLAKGGPADLSDASGFPVLLIQKGKGYVEMEVQPASDLKDSEYSQLNMVLRVDSAIIGKLATAFAKYPKWW